MKRKPDPTINAHAGTDDRASSWDTNPNTGFYAPPSLNSRTMKRWRDNREDDEKIYGMSGARTDCWAVLILK